MKVSTVYLNEANKCLFILGLIRQYSIIHDYPDKQVIYEQRNSEKPLVSFLYLVKLR